MTKIKKNSLFLAVAIYQSKVDPSAGDDGAFRGVPGRVGAIPNWTSGLSPNPYIHARVSKTGGSRSPQLPQIIIYTII